MLGQSAEARLAWRLLSFRLTPAEVGPHIGSVWLPPARRGYVAGTRLNYNSFAHGRDLLKQEDAW